jgi:hypothetical protein
MYQEFLRNRPLLVIYIERLPTACSDILFTDW